MSMENVPVLETVPFTAEQHSQTLSQQIRLYIGRVAASILLVVGGATLRPETAFAETGGYPYAEANNVRPGSPYYEWGYKNREHCGNYCDSPGGSTTLSDGKYYLYSERGFAIRNCTDWTAKRVQDLTGKQVPVTLKNAKDWDNNAASDWSVDTSPEPGDIAQSEAGIFGHVGVVEVADRDSSGKIVKVIISDYNRDQDGKYNRTDYYPDANGTFWRDSAKTKKWDHFLDLNGTGKGVNGEDLSNTAPASPPDPDTDNDGVKDSQDRCPAKPGFVASNGCPVKADYNRDGRADIVGFYRYDGNVARMRGWWGQTNGYTTEPTGPWEAAGWDASRIIPAGRGDFNDDGQEDLAAFYRHDNGMIDLNIWYGNGRGNFTPFRAWHQPNGWDAARLIPVGSGDINGDGRSDIIAFYRHDNNTVDLRIWYGQSSGHTTEPTGPWSGQGWDGSRIIPVGIGDMDDDGRLDISTFYRHDNGMVDHNVWYGNGVGDFTLARPWHVDVGWEGDRFIPAGVADFNGDGKADSAVFYRHDNNLVDLRIWYGTGDRVMSAPGGPWSANGWEGERIIPTGTGDYNGDGKADIATFYRHIGGMMDMNIWYGDGHGNFIPFRAWHVDTGWEGERLVMAKG
jgi:surface antigen